MARRGFHIHTVIGPFHASNQTHLDTILAGVARDAIAMGRGDQCPWLVDNDGKPLRPLKPYVEYARASLLAVGSDAWTAPQRDQNEQLAGPLIELEAFRGSEVMEDLARWRESRIIDPVARHVLRSNAKAIAAALLRMLDGGEQLAADVEALGSMQSAPAKSTG